MPVITMRIPCKITPKGSNDLYGMPTPGTTRNDLCAIIKLQTKSQHSTVRADSGATRGHADEVIAESVLLLNKKIEPGIGDVIAVRGVTLQVISVRHRTDVMGRIDHYEVGCAIE